MELIIKPNMKIYKTKNIDTLTRSFCPHYDCELVQNTVADLKEYDILLHTQKRVRQNPEYWVLQTECSKILSSHIYIEQFNS